MGESGMMRRTAQTAQGDGLAFARRWLNTHNGMGEMVAPDDHDPRTVAPGAIGADHTPGKLWELERKRADALERALGVDPESTWARRSDHDISDRARAFGRVNILASGIIRAGVLQPVRTKRPY